jgi:hypothetical protein
MDYNNLRNYADRVKSEDNGLDRRIIARLAGVTFEGRQKLLAKMNRNTPVRLERDRRNEYDFYAVQVMAKLKNKWHHVGFIPRTMSKLIAKGLDKGNLLSAEVHRVTGGMTDDYSGEQLNYGLEIRITPER